MECPWCHQKVTGPYWKHLALDPPEGCTQVSVALGKGEVRKDWRTKKRVIQNKPTKKVK